MMDMYQLMPFSSCCSDVWASIFQHLPDLPHALPQLRLVCRQVRILLHSHTSQERLSCLVKLLAAEVKVLAYPSFLFVVT